MEIGRPRCHGPALLWLVLRKAVVAILVALIDILEDITPVECLLGLGLSAREADVFEAVGADADRGEDVLKGEVAQEGERVGVLRVASGYVEDARGQWRRHEQQ